MKVSQFSSIDEDDKKHLLKLIEWISDEVLRAGGDGDALWYSEHYDTKEIFELVKEYNNTLKYKWKFVEFNEEAKTIHVYDNQEGFMITNDKVLLDNAPDWQQCIVIN